jgi:hypothetical protein
MSLSAFIRSVFKTPKSSTEQVAIDRVAIGVALATSITFGPTPSATEIAAEHVPPGSGRWYVYCHRDCAGRIFYIGKGTGNRAWSKERHPIWHQYVEARSESKFTVQIVSYHETSDEAEGVEQSFIARYGAQLVNWINVGRDTDFAACDRYWAAKKANQKFVADTKAFETSDPSQAVERYRQAMAAMYDYSAIVLERGLVAELKAEIFRSGGDDNILDRLTLCLFRLERYEELNAALADYLERFPSEYQSEKMKAVLKRRDRANKR